MKKTVNSDRELVVLSPLILILVLLTLLAGCVPITATEEYTRVSLSITSTPLEKAVVLGDINAVKDLLNKGADVCKALDFAASDLTPNIYNDEILRILINAAYEKINKGGSCPRLLYHAARGGCNYIVEELLAKGYNVDARNGEWTPLVAAAMGGQKHKETVKILLNNGADLDLAIELLKEVASKNKQLLAEASRVPGLVEIVRGSYNKANKGIALLSQFKPRQMVQQTNVSQNITKEDLANIIKSVVEDAKKSQNKDIKTASAVQSDIDKPFFSTASKIMGDNDCAIIIGIEGYSSLPKSDYSYDDAKLVKDYLKALGVKERNIELLTDEKATLSGIMKSIEAWLPNKLKKGGKVFVYYSGHGSPNPVTGKAFLVPYDGDPNYLNVTGYPLKRLYEKLGRLQASEVIVVLDSCFSGAGGRSVLAKGARPLVMTSQSAVLPQNMVVLSATQGSQISTSFQEKGYGIFTYYFLKALKNGKKSVAEIYEHIKPYVEDEAKSINVRQSPSINPNLDKLKGRFLLRK
jgi:hypothetical protein